MIYFRKRNPSGLISKCKDHFTFIFYWNILIQLILPVINSLKCSYILTSVSRILLILLKYLWPFLHIYHSEFIFPLWCWYFFAMLVFHCILPSIKGSFYSSCFPWAYRISWTQIPHECWCLPTTSLASLPCKLQANTLTVHLRLHMNVIKMPLGSVLNFSSQTMNIHFILNTQHQFALPDSMSFLFWRNTLLLFEWILFTPRALPSY